MNLISIENIETYYGAIAAVKGISINVKKGEIVALLGANGAGKSTLISTICGNPKPSSGVIRFEGQDIAGLDSHEISRLGIAISPEGRRVFSEMTVLENLQMGAWLTDAHAQKRNLALIFDLFPRLAERRNQSGGTLSGGEQQMLAIGRALMSEPKLLLLDEPSLGLAPQISKSIFKALKEVNIELNTTILLAEQDAHSALKIAHRGYVLVTGEVELAGLAKDLLNDPAVRAAYLEGGSKD